MNQDDLTEELLTVAHVGSLLAVSRSAVYNLMATGKLRYVKIGRNRRISRAELLGLIARSTQGGWDIPAAEAPGRTGVASFSRTSPR